MEAKGPLFVLAATGAVRAFKAFSTDNDPHGGHDVGTFEICGERLFWKIDYFDWVLQFGSPNPADCIQTRRILTIMLASAYCGQR
jgi:hypothetical protein